MTRMVQPYVACMQFSLNMHIHTYFFEILKTTYLYFFLTRILLLLLFNHNTKNYIYILVTLTLRPCCMRRRTEGTGSDFWPSTTSISYFCMIFTATVFICKNVNFFPKQLLGPALNAKNLCEGSCLNIPLSEIHLSGLKSSASSPQTDFILPNA